MDCKEVRVDMRIPNPKDREENVRAAQIMFQMNHTMPFTEEYQTLLKNCLERTLEREATLQHQSVVPVSVP